MCWFLSTRKESSLTITPPVNHPKGPCPQRVHPAMGVHCQSRRHGKPMNPPHGSISIWRGAYEVLLYSSNSTHVPGLYIQRPRQRRKHARFPSTLATRVRDLTEQQWPWGQHSLSGAHRLIHNSNHEGPCTLHLQDLISDLQATRSHRLIQRVSMAS